MTEIGFFASPRYAPGKRFAFDNPKKTEWVLIRKLFQRNSQAEEIDVRAGTASSYSVATFLVLSEPENIEAYMRVYLQVPHKGTEFSSVEDRARQATYGKHSEVKALKAFHAQQLTITPALFGIKEDIQDDQGLIPGGYVTYLVFQRVPGVRLANDTTLPQDRNPQHTFFKDFNDLQRDYIRQIFGKAHERLEEAGWVPCYAWATNLIWDADSSKLYFVDFSYPIRAGIPQEDLDDPEFEEEEEDVPITEIWREWGLAFPPEDPKDRSDLSKWIL